MNQLRDTSKSQYLSVEDNASKIRENCFLGAVVESVRLHWPFGAGELSAVQNMGCHLNHCPSVQSFADAPIAPKAENMCLNHPGKKYFKINFYSLI